MNQKPREYRNNNSSETINVNDVRKASKGFFVQVEGKAAFVDTTDATNYGLKLQLIEVPEKPNRQKHTLVNLIFTDGSVSPQGYVLNVADRKLAPEGMAWLWADDMSLNPGQSRKHYAPTLGALMTYMRSKLHFTSCVW